MKDDRAVIIQMPVNTENTPKVSAVVPVWNAGTYVSKCIESLRNQTLKEIEMIFVDDCGTDESMEIVQAASKEDPRIKIIKNPENYGAGKSRNEGIRAAKGEYLSFIDPDDHIEKTFLEILFLLAVKEGLDIVKGKCIMKNIDGMVVPSHRDLNNDIKTGLKSGKPLYALFTYEHHGALFRRSFLQKNGIFYGSSARAQDSTFLLRSCIKSDRFDIADNAYYYFCERENSAMHREDAAALEGFLLSVSERVDEILMTRKNDPYAIPFLRGVFILALREYDRYSQTDGVGAEKQKYLQKLREEMLRIPFCSQMTKNSFPLYMLKEKTVALPMIPTVCPGST